MTTRRIPLPRGMRGTMLRRVEKAIREGDIQAYLEARQELSLDEIKGYRNDEGESLLFAAVESANKAECAYFVGNLAALGLDVNASDGEGDYPITRAAKRGCYEALFALVEVSGIDLNVSHAGGTALIHLSSQGDEGALKAVRLLVEKGVNVNQQDGHRWTALHWAALNARRHAPGAPFNRVPMIELLYELGIDASIENELRETAFTLFDRTQELFTFPVGELLAGDENPAGLRA